MDSEMAPKRGEYIQEHHSGEVLHKMKTANGRKLLQPRYLFTQKAK